MKLAWRRAEKQGQVRAVSAAIAAPTAPPVTAPVGAGDVALLGASLPGELRLLCRGLVNCAWSDRLAAVTTEVRLPDDAAHALALRALCWALADEFGIEQLVCRQGEAWIVRFSRREGRPSGDGGGR